MGECPSNILRIIYTCDRLEGKVFLYQAVRDSSSITLDHKSAILIGRWCVSDIKAKDVRANNCPPITLLQKIVPQHSCSCSYHPLCFHFCNPFLNLWNLLSFSLFFSFLFPGATSLSVKSCPPPYTKFYKFISYLLPLDISIFLLDWRFFVDASSHTSLTVILIKHLFAGNGLKTHFLGEVMIGQSWVSFLIREMLIIDFSF